MWCVRRTTSATFLRFRQTSHEHVSTCWLTTHTWFHIPEKFHLRSWISQKTIFFRVQKGTLFVPRLRVMGNVQRRLDCFHPRVDIPQMCAYLGDFCWGMYHFPAIHVVRLCILCHGISNGKTTMPIFQTYSPDGATIGSTICTGTLHQYTFSSLKFS